ncbi:pappalysin-1-like isoform X2 [Hydractinia symbiolongicarpus]|nr:pappalysin-1-like isoform X2 [Hydractinia symbiolongicarpus]
MICDNPEIIRNYAGHPDLFLKRKTLRYRIINIANDDGSDPILSRQEISQKHLEINKVFERYNITWKGSSHLVRNTKLRNKTVVLKCYAYCENERDQCKIKTEEPDCALKCNTSTQLRNNVCNPECNKILRTGNKSDDWDGGDCCNPLARNTNISETCFDKSSPNRAFITERELKEEINLSNKQYLNLIPVKLREDMLGKATFPWLQDVYGLMGGITMNFKNFRSSPQGAVNDIIHELGHVLGLWHVHKGVSELRCDDACAERKPSMVHGDLCEDTNPTPTNLFCRDEVISESKCGNQKYKNTPYRNFMGYTKGLCPNQFTLQQQARMHCYIDLMYQQWGVDTNEPSIIPLQPRVLNSSPTQVQLTWMPPIGFGNEYVKHGCHRCNPSENTLKQYASHAYSPQDITQPNYRSGKALGPPDVVDTCTIAETTQAWSPVNGCGTKDCMLEVSFEKIVVATGIKIWVTYNSKDSIKDIQLVHPDTTSTSLGPASTQCNVPYSKQITSLKLIAKVRIYLLTSTDNIAAIDAVQLTSVKEHVYCKKCRKLRIGYNVYRSPGFADSQFKRVTGVRFIDNEIVREKKYQYQIQVQSGKYKSSLSLPLLFELTSGYCGDGVVEKSLGEECDDANGRNGDGCSISCKMEAVFNCQHEPSLCYKYDQDGICEHFEKGKSNHDCGFYAPFGFTDQWASRVIGQKGQSDFTCPETVIEGKPCLNLKCVSSFEEINTKKAWRPCVKTGLTDYWIEASYKNEVIAAAVIIYLASDGKAYESQRNTWIEIELKDTTGAYHKATNKETSVSCKNNPMSVHVMHDMTQPVFKTVGVRIKFNASAASIGISGIALRTADTQYYHKCKHNELYDPRTKKCRLYNSEVLACAPFKMAHAKLNCTGNNDGDHCYVTCHHGYLPRDNFKAHCDAGKWMKGSTCTPVDCGIPNLRHAIASCLGTTYGHTCSYKCQSNAKLAGSDTNLLCQADGTWRKSNAHCYVTCSKPTHVKDSLLYTSDSIANECSETDTEEFQMGTRCRYRCNPGHRPVRYKVGTVSGGNTVNILCNDIGEWKQDGYCEKITCPSLSTMNRYMYKCTDENRFQSVCSTTCLGTKKLPYKVTCKHNGQWSSTFDFCGSKGRCSHFPSVHGLDTTACKDFTIGSVCRPQCMKRVNVIPDIVIKGKEDAKEVVLYCMPNKEWKPRLTELACLNPCKDYELNDGMCDCHNNNKHCRYDGGDCCKKDLDDEVYYWSDPCPCIDKKALTNLEKLKQKSTREKSRVDAYQQDREETGDAMESDC